MTLVSAFKFRDTTPDSLLQSREHTMDASAFEADVDDDVSFADLYDELPGNVKRAVRAIHH